MNVRRIVLSSILCLCVTLHPYAQKTYAVSRFTTDNGLPSNGIKGLQWDDATGFFWIATEAGVTRYNGSDFITWSKSNTPGLLSERMLCMLQTRQGRIVTSDEAGNIFFVLQNKLQFMERTPVDTRPSTFRLIGLLASSSLFRQTAAHPPAGFGFNFQTETLIPLSNDHLLIHRRDSASNYRSGLYDYTLGDTLPRFLGPLPDDTRIFPLGAEQTLFGFHQATGFFRIDSLSTTITQPPIPCRTQDGQPIPALSTGRLFWVNGMTQPILIIAHQAWLLDYKHHELTAKLICNAIPGGDLIDFAIYNQQKAMLALGTDSKGIILIRENQVHPIAAIDAPADHGTATYSQVALPGNGILTSQGNVYGMTAAPPPAQLPIHTGFNNFVFISPDSLLWFSHGDSIGAWSPRTGRTSFLPAGKGSITDGFAIADNRLYVANAIGIGLIKDGRIDYSYTYPQPDINSNVPFSMLEIVPGTLAIASCNGLFRYNTRNRRLDTLFTQPGVCVRALWKYKDYLFIGTYGKGIYCWHQGILKPIPLDRDKYLAYAHCFMPDKLGYCWISTNKGLFRARPSDMIGAYENNEPEIYYHYYGRNDGMDITELNGGCTPCALRLNDSTLSFPSMDGLVWVDPTKTLTRLPEGNIYIDAFTADSQKINTASSPSPELPSHTREIEFHLGFPAWVNPENIYIDYKLDPWQKDWHPLDFRHDPDLHFSNLPPGEYTLMLRKLNGFGNQNYAYTNASFRILPRWFQRSSVWLLFAAALALAVIGIVRLRTRRLHLRQARLKTQVAEKTHELKQKNEELERTDTINTRLISIISHDLITPLKFLHMAGKNLVEKKDLLSEELHRETITEIMNTAKELELLSTNMLNWIKYRNEDSRLVKETFLIDQLIDHIMGIFSPMAKHKDIRLINLIDEDTSIFQFSEPVRIIVYNLILNALNFSTHGAIVVSGKFSAAGFAVSVKDNGVGMTQEQINNVMADHFIISSANVDRRKGHGLGYLIIKDLLKISRGSLSIESEKDHGTQVTILFPTH